MRLFAILEFSRADVRPREMGERELSDAEERELESERMAGRIREVPGVVPPLDRRIGVGAVVAGKCDRRG